MPKTFDDLAQRQADLWDEMNEIILVAQAEGRDLYAAEARKFDAKEEELVEVSRELDPNAGDTSGDRFERHRKRNEPAGSSMGLGVATSPNGGYAVSSSELRYGEPLGTSSMQEFVFRNGNVPQEHRSLSLGKFVRGMISGNWQDADAERRAMGEGSGSAGGFMVPDILQGRIIDLARNRSAVLQSGAQIVPMETSTHYLPRWESDPDVRWHAENTQETASEGTVGRGVLNAKSLLGYVRMSREVAEDSNPSLEAQVERAFAAQVGLAFDRAALYGDPAADEPEGLINNAAVPQTALDAVPTDYSYLLKAKQRLLSLNESPTGAIGSPREEATLAGLNASDGQPLMPPEYVREVPRVPTNQIRTSGSTADGTNNGSDMFMADWSMLALGLRTRTTLTVLTERFADFGQIAVLVWFRGDIAPMRTNSFDITTAIQV